jgi:SAM-dependent methyltransferase
MAAKDNFSSGSDNYAKYRPAYPAVFFTYLNSLVEHKQNAWDCATGNGQIAYPLAASFEHVFATDISRSQIDNALQADNIFYSVQPAEKTRFENKKFDLIVVGQAIHWFDFDRFYSEVRRTAKENALLCVAGYGRIGINARIDELITTFYEQVIGGYWDKERKYIDENYKTIPFPFNETPAPDFVNTQRWTLEHLIGYLNTWSAVKHFMRENGYNPVDKLQSQIGRLWDKKEKEVTFPLLLRIGKM